MGQKLFCFLTLWLLLKSKCVFENRKYALASAVGIKNYNPCVRFEECLFGTCIKVAGIKQVTFLSTGICPSICRLVTYNFSLVATNIQKVRMYAPPVGVLVLTHANAYK